MGKERERRKDDIDDLRRKVEELENILERLTFALTGAEYPIAEAVVAQGALLGVIERAGPNGLIFRPAVDVRLTVEAKEYLQSVLDGIRDYQVGYSDSATADVVITERSSGWLDAITFNGLKSKVELEKAKLAVKVAVEMSLRGRGGGHGGNH